jgi:hypothetical protein
MMKREESGSISQRHGSADLDPDPHQNVMDPQHCREQFRVALLRLVTAAAPGSEAAKSAALFYGRVLHRDLFPERTTSGGGGGRSAENTSAADPGCVAPLHHSSHGPWTAECVRCVSLFKSRASKVLCTL